MAYMHKFDIGWALPRTPLRELTVLPRPPSKITMTSSLTSNEGASSFQTLAI